MKHIKVGTWNLDGHWSDQHESLLISEQCDVWLLTEVHPSIHVNRFNIHLSAQRMSRGQHYAAILSRSPLTPIPHPHPASVAAVVEDITFCSSILPWAGCAGQPVSPWHNGESVSEMVRETVDSLIGKLPKGSLVWGGDWNQNLEGGWQHVGSKGGQSHICDALKVLELQIPTKDLPHRINGAYTIDHIAVPKRWECSNATRVSTAGLSDHDAYMIDATPL